MSCGPFVHSCVWQIGTVLELFEEVLFYLFEEVLDQSTCAVSLKRQILKKLWKDAGKVATE